MFLKIQYTGLKCFENFTNALKNMETRCGDIWQVYVAGLCGEK